MPYDRPVLSKNLVKASRPETLYLRDETYFKAHDIEVRRGAKVVSVDAQHRLVRLANGEELAYDSALVATGARPRMLAIPGSNLPGVLPLRTPEDVRLIAVRCGKTKSVVVVGSSFIGMEIAATLRRNGCEVTVLGMEATPFQRLLGSKLGSSLKTFFESKGVEFIGEAVVTKIEDTNGKLETVLRDGRKLKCDSVVVGVGVIPNADFVTGAEKAKDGSLVTDASMRTSAAGLFAAGDVATYMSPRIGQAQRIEHWDVAMSQGRVAARTMLGKQEAFDATPFFWTSLFGKNLRCVGSLSEYDDIIVDGSFEDLNFAAYYCIRSSVVAVVTMARDPIAVVAGELMRTGRMPDPDKLRSGKLSAADLIAELQRP